MNTRLNFHHFQIFVTRKNRKGCAQTFAQNIIADTEYSCSSESDHNQLIMIADRKYVCEKYNNKMELIRLINHSILHISDKVHTIAEI